MANQQMETILLLDDDQHFRLMVGRLLMAAGYRVVEAQSAMVATAILTEKKPVAAIVDYRLPGMNGVDWIEQMRTFSIGIPMMLSTALELDEETIKMLHDRLDVNIIVSKPIDPATFLQQVHRLLPPSSPEVKGDSAVNKKSAAVPVDAPKISEMRIAGSEVQDPIESFIRDELEAELTRAKIEYLRDTLSELNVFLAALSELATLSAVGNVDAATTARDLAHKIRGTSGSFGLSVISHRAKVIEELFTDPVESGSAAALANGTIARLLSELRSDVMLAMGDREVMHQKVDS